MKTSALRSFLSALLFASATLQAADPEAFTERYGVAEGTIITSETVGVTGFEGSLPISISGGENPQYKIGAGAFTNAAGNISSGQSLTVRHTSARQPNTLSTSTVMIGSTPILFRTRTAEPGQDYVPDAFSFGAKGQVAPSTLVESATIVPTGYTVALPIAAVSGAQYRINGGAWTSAAGSLSPGQSLAMRHTSNKTRLQYTKSTLRLGSVSGTFTTRTQGQVEGAAYPLPVAVPPMVSVANASGREGTASMLFTVTLSKVSDKTVTVGYATANQTAEAGKDYTALNGSLSFAPGETSKTLSVALLGDDCGEPVETYGLALSAPVNATLGTAVAVATLTDDDPLGAPFRVGSARRDVSPTPMQIAGDVHDYCVAPLPPQKVYLGGFGIRDDFTTCYPTGFLKGPVDGVAGAPNVRVMVVEQPAAPPLQAVRVAFVTLDAVGAGNIIQEGVKRRINTATGIAKNNILFGQTHAHSGMDLQGLWGGVPYSVRQNIYTKAAEAAVEAVSKLTDAEVRYSTGLIDNPSYNNYRRSDLSYGSDKRMTLLQARRIDNGAVISTIVQYAAHPTGLGSSNPKIHGDWVAGLEARFEEAYPGSMAMLYNGPIADASFNGGAAGNAPAGSDAFQRVEFAGKGLADRGIALLNASSKRLIPQLAVQHANAVIPITNQLFIAVAQKGWFNGYYDFTLPPDPEAKATPAPQAISTAQTTVSRLTFGKIGCDCLEVATIPGEASNVIGQYIRSLAPRDMMLLGLTHNSFGYILSEEQYGTEETRNYPTSPPGPEDVLLYPTGYEEGVSLGAATAPALREQAYNPLFGAPPGTGLSPPTP